MLFSSTVSLNSSTFTYSFLKEDFEEEKNILLDYYEHMFEEPRVKMSFVNQLDCVNFTDYNPPITHIKGYRISGIHYIFCPTQYVSEIHVDQLACVPNQEVLDRLGFDDVPVGQPQVLSLQLPLSVNDTAITSFYTKDSSPIKRDITLYNKVSYNYNRSIIPGTERAYYYLHRKSRIEKIDEFTFTKPAIINVSLPHQVYNPGEARDLLSIRFLKDPWEWIPEDQEKNIP